MNPNPMLIGALFGLVGFGLTFFLKNEDKRDQQLEDKEIENKKLKKELEQLKKTCGTNGN